MIKRTLKITRITRTDEIKMNDTVLIEEPLDLNVNSQPLVNIMCLPQDLKELAVGFLYSIGYISEFKDVEEMTLEQSPRKIQIILKEDCIVDKTSNIQIGPLNRVIEASSGMTPPWRNIIKEGIDKEQDPPDLSRDVEINAEVIFSSVQKMQEQTSLFKETGGCHGAAIFNFDGHLLTLKEDIGRHNAIDKVIGDSLMNEIQLESCFLTSTGRLTGDSVLKAVRAHIPLVASISTAIDSGIRLASSHGITLIGFVKKERMNIYTYPNRLVLP